MSGKAYEKAVEAAGELDDLPPPYEEEAAPAITSTTDDLLSIVIDGTLIFPTVPPARAMYELNRELNVNGMFGVERIDHTVTLDAEGREIVKSRNKLIYDFHHPVFGGHVTIAGKRPGTRREMWLERGHGILGKSWEVLDVAANRATTLLYKVRAGSSADKTVVWKDTKGRVLMTEAVSSGPDGREQRLLQTHVSLSKNDADAMISLWCARVWYENMVEQQKAAAKGR